jgi:hypothetical protein
LHLAGACAEAGINSYPLTAPAEAATSFGETVKPKAMAKARMLKNNLIFFIIKHFG